MDEGLSFETVLSFFKRNLFLSGITFIGLVLLVFGFYGMQLMQPAQESVVYESGEEQQEKIERKSPQPQTIYVDIAGAVERPGVYELTSESRVQDALTKAGGLSEKADAQGIAKVINLASKVADGMKLYFPFKGETGVLGTAQSGEITSATGIASTQTGGLININLASQSELESLPGIGEVTALKIIKGRPYGSLKDLTDKKIIGESLYAKISELVTVN